MATQIGNESPELVTEGRPARRPAGATGERTFAPGRHGQVFVTPDWIKKLHMPAGWEIWAKLGIVAFTVVIILSAIATGFMATLFNVIPKAPLGKLWFWTMTVYGAVYYCVMVWRIWLWLSYRPFRSVDDEDLPAVSVVIPAYNEGPLVLDSIRSVAQNDYPKDKLQIIVVDDGSTDDTWRFIRMAASETPLNIETIRQPVNKGKRHALYEGFQLATGEVWVTIDSDSIVERSALRNGVAPIVLDQRIGLVAGCVKVLNRNDSFITRILKVQFSLSFAFSRAYQSMIRGLLTTPGALSLYRAAAVRPVLQKWLNQTFLGRPCLTGEDRSMTNLIAAQGFHSFFQSNAIVWAQMPASYSGMSKMFLRWARSNIRETAVLMSFLFKPFRRDYLWGFRINSVLIASTLIVPYFLIFHSYYLLLTNLYWMFRHSVVVSLISVPLAIIYYRNEKDSDFAWVIAYEFFWVLSCQWIIPYAFLTCRRQGAWITRGSGSG